MKRQKTRRGNEETRRDKMRGTDTREEARNDNERQKKLEERKQEET